MIFLHQLEFSFQVVKQWEINLISQHIVDDWKTLGDGLELSVAQLQKLEAENLGQPKIAVQEMLKGYMRDFPDTSIGFIASVLRETGHIKALTQLARFYS